MPRSCAGLSGGFSSLGPHDAASGQALASEHTPKRARMPGPGPLLCGKLRVSHTPHPTLERLGRGRRRAGHTRRPMQRSRHEVPDLMKSDWARPRFDIPGASSMTERSAQGRTTWRDACPARRCPRAHARPWTEPARPPLDAAAHGPDSRALEKKRPAGPGSSEIFQKAPSKLSQASVISG